MNSKTAQSVRSFAPSDTADIEVVAFINMDDCEFAQCSRNSILMNFPAIRGMNPISVEIEQSRRSCQHTLVHIPHASPCCL